MKLPELTSEKMHELEKAALEEHVTPEKLMERAGMATADLASRLFNGRLKGRKFLVLAGKGSNGGDAVCAARYLHRKGASCVVALAAPVEECRRPVVKQLNLLPKAVPVISSDTFISVDSVKGFDLIIDGLIGYSAQGNPKGRVAGLINLAANSGIKVLAIDVPSGLDCNSGLAMRPCMQAAYTLTMGMLKKGLLDKPNKKHAGSVHLADIGIPALAYAKAGVKLPKGLFRKKLIKLS